MSSTTRQRVRAWIDGYERAWRTAGTAAVRELFADDASYRLSPYEAPIVGIDAIAAMWEREREGPDERFTMTSELVAVEADAAVARVEVEYPGPPQREYRDLWVMRFDAGGKCRAFEEWPFWPGRARVMQP